MIENRHDEIGSVPFRSGRFFQMNGRWYFQLRGEPPRGPYADKREAQGEFLELMRQQATFGEIDTDPPPAA